MDNTEYTLEATESAQLILQNVAVLSELSSQLKKESKHGEIRLNSLNSALFQAGKDISSLNQCVDSLLIIAKKLVHLSLQIVPIKDPNFKSLKSEADKLLNVLDDMKDNEDEKYDGKSRQSERPHKTCSPKCLTPEKYPDHCSRESLLDISNVVALPTVPEDIFADFLRPKRTVSSCSLKTMRKVKFSLQKACGIEPDNYDTLLPHPRREYEPVNTNTQTTDIESISANTQTIETESVCADTQTTQIRSVDTDTQTLHHPFQ